MSTSFPTSRPIVVDSELPAQSPDTNGRALISNGMTASWNTILGMIGTNAGQVPPHQFTNEILPSQAGNNGMVLSTDGVNVQWVEAASGTGSPTVDINDILPDQSGNGGSMLTTNGSQAYWSMPNIGSSIPSTEGVESGSVLLYEGGEVGIQWTNRYTTTSPQLHVGVSGVNDNTIVLDSTVYPSGTCIFTTSPDGVTVVFGNIWSYDVGSTIDIIQAGDGQVQVDIYNNPGVTIGTAVGNATRSKYSKITLLNITGDLWVVYGDAVTL